MNNSFKLSICIATFNRGQFIGQTLDELIIQCDSRTEIVIYDGNSGDETESAVRSRQGGFKGLTYIKAETNGGIDQDYDRAVQSANGEYCWLMTDDDLVAPNAVKRIQQLLTKKPTLLVLNAEVWDKGFQIKLLNRFIVNSSSPEIQSLDELMRVAGACLSFIGSVIFRRDEWLSRDRARFYGSLFIHFGVIFQRALPASYIIEHDPLIRIRYGNALWTGRGFEIWMYKWPDLVHSFKNVLKLYRENAAPTSASHYFKYLLQYRSMGIFGLREFNNLTARRERGVKLFLTFLVALLPKPLVASAIALLYAVARKQNLLGFYDVVQTNKRNPVVNWIAKKRGFSHWIEK